MPHRNTYSKDRGGKGGRGTGRGEYPAVDMWITDGEVSGCGRPREEAGEGARQGVFVHHRVSLRRSWAILEARISTQDRVTAELPSRMLLLVS